MAKEFSRTSRVAELIRRELASIVSTKLNDPRVGLVTITAVEVSKDLRSARIFVTRLGDDGDALDALQKASGFLRRELGSRLEMKNIPALKFVYDHSVQRGVELTHLIEELNKDGQADGC